MTTSPDHANVRLGKQPYRDDPRTLKLARYVDFAQLLPNVPPAWTWSSKVHQWPMYLNDRIGDCTCAEVGHHIQLWSAAAGHEIDVADSDVLGLYEQVSGYNPSTGANDNGAVILDVLSMWRHQGIAGHKIGAFAEVDHTNRALLEAAIYLFGGLSIGVALPLAAQRMGTYWHVPRGGAGGANAADSWGGHCVYVCDFNRSGLTVITWGEVTHMTWGFWNRYVDEAWCAISTDFMPNGQTPQGFDLAHLQADLAAIGAVH